MFPYCLHTSILSTHLTQKLENLISDCMSIVGFLICDRIYLDRVLGKPNISSFMSCRHIQILWDPSSQRALMLASTIYIYDFCYKRQKLDIDNGILMRYSICPIAVSMFARLHYLPM